jgi:DNA-binding SARP family transcriptional activator
LRKARTLVKVLALEPERRLHREQAMELLWPDLTATAAQNNLHQALHAARRVIGADRLTLEDGMLALAGDVDTDVDAFEAAAAAARASGEPHAYTRALERFGGELLPEDRYEPWADARRAALTDRHNALCLELAERQEPQEALATLQRALAADPLHEPAHRALMRAYHRLGRRQDALAQYQRLRAALRPPFKRTYPVQRAARDIADGFDKRARRVCTPGFVRIAHVLRAALTTRPFERDLVAAAPDIERLFAEQAAERGRLETSVSERTAARLP